LFFLSNIHFMYGSYFIIIIAITPAAAASWQQQ